MGTPAAAQKGTIQEFCQSIYHHLVVKQGQYAYTILDLTGFSAQQIVAVKEYLTNQLPANLLAKIKPIGFTLP
jgi:hypothetical protein